MKREQILSDVLEVFEKLNIFHCLGENIELEHNLTQDLGMDSLDEVELEMKLEEHFDLANDALTSASEGWRTVNDVVDSLSKILNNDN